MFGAIADFERGLIQERTQVGLSAARTRGRLGGRPKGLTEEAKKKARLVYQLYTQQDMSVQEICNNLGIGSRSTAYRYLEWGKAEQKNMKDSATRFKRSKPKQSASVRNTQPGGAE